MPLVANDIGFLPGGTYSLAEGVDGTGRFIVGQADTGSSGFFSHGFVYDRFASPIPTITDLDILAGGSYSIARGCALVGGTLTIVGQADNAAGFDHAVYWTFTGGIVTGPMPLAFLGTGDTAQAFAISHDATVIGGASTVIPFVGPTAQPFHPALWTAFGAPVDIVVQGANGDGIAIAVNSNGTTAVGGGSNTMNVPWKWVSGTLSAVPMFAGEIEGVASAVSANAQTIGGQTDSAITADHPFIWTLAGGTTLIGFPIGDSFGTLRGMSGDGLTSVGESGPSIGMGNAWMWTLADGFSILSPLAGGSATLAFAISFDSSTPVGKCVVAGQQHAIFWASPSLPIPIPFCGNTHTTTSFSAAWTDSPAADTYTVDWRKVGDISFTEVTGITDMFLLITGLTPSTTYEFKVDAITGGIHSGFSGLVQCTTDDVIQFPPPIRVPLPPIPPSPVAPVVIPLRPIPSQTITITLSNQSCRINVRQTSTGIYLDLYVNDALIIGGVHCQDLNPIVRNRYLGFTGDLAFYDTQPSTITGPNDPVYTGLGSRYVLEYYQGAP